MPLVANDLSAEMLSATAGKTDAASALSDIGNAIANYIKSNALLVMAWNGIDPGSGSPDPVVVAEAAISSLTITLTASGATSPGAGVNHLAGEITAGVQAGVFAVTTPGFSLAPGSMSDVTALSLSMSSAHADRNAAMQDLANQIINWFTSYAPAAILLGSHANFLAPPGTGAVAAGPWS